MIKYLEQEVLDTFINKYYTQNDKELLAHANIYYLGELESYVIVSEGYQIIDYLFKDMEDMNTLITHLQRNYDELVCIPNQNQLDFETLGFEKDDDEYVWLETQKF